MEALIACDIGGTQLRVATFDAVSGEMIQQKRIPTQAPGETAVERLMGLIFELWPTEGHVRAIGAAAPGFVDPEKGIIFITPNIPGWNGLPLRQILEERGQIMVRGDHLRHPHQGRAMIGHHRLDVARHHLMHAHSIRCHPGPLATVPTWPPCSLVRH